MQGIKSDYCLRTYDDTNRDCPLGNGIFRSIEAFHQLMAYFFSAQRQYLKGRSYPGGYDDMFFIRRNTKRRQITPKRPVVLFFFVQNREIRICGKHLLVFNAFATPGFFAIEFQNGQFYGRIIDILNRASILVILSMGMTFVIATGGIDISQGSVIAISGAICCSLIGGAGDGTANMPLLPACLIAVLVCALCGVWNGFLVSKLKIQPMVATLILLTAGRGIAMLITKGQNVTVYYEPFTYIGTTIPGSPLPTTIFIAALMVLFVVLIQKKTSVGLFVQAVGINANAARRTGLKVSSIIFMVYVFSGICAGIAGLMESSMIAAADPNNAGLNMEMDAILSVALGGTLLSGGKFYIGGSIIGAITIQTMTTTLYALGVSSEQLPVYKALVVILICLLQSEKFKGVLEKRTAEKAVKQR